MLDRRTVVFCLGTIMLSFGLTGCKDRVDPFDRHLGFSHHEFKKRFYNGQGKPGSEPEESGEEKKNEPIARQIPAFAPIVLPPELPALPSEKLISIAVTEDVPLRDVFLEIGRLADLDIEIDPNLRSGIIIRMKNQPLNKVVERISERAGLRYSLQDGVLRVERDLPYIEQYSVDFLNIERSVASKMSTSMTLGGESGSGGGGRNTTGNTTTSDSNTLETRSGSESNITAAVGSDLWEEVIHNIGLLLGTDPNQASVGRSKKNGADAGGSGVRQTSVADSVAAEARKARMDQVNDETRQDQQAVFFSVNRTAGIITVHAPQRLQREIAKYLRYIYANASAQVLIEAKVLEVKLSEGFYSGIDWAFLNKEPHKIGNFIGLSSPNSNASDMSFGVIRGSTIDKDPAKMTSTDPLAALIRFTERFGNATTLASPRIHAMNNQQALLSFVQNYVYFTMNISPGQTSVGSSTTGTSSQTLVNPPTVNSTVRTVPIGVILNILPSINLETKEVLMNIRPTLTRNSGTVSDPAFRYTVNSTMQQLASNGSSTGDLSSLKSDIPVLDVREMDSIVKLRSGDIMVLGGMIDQRAANTQQGIPGVSRIPVAGRLFGKNDQSLEVVETVIFLKATILEPDAGLAGNDWKFYKNFSRDPNPWIRGKTQSTEASQPIE
jgi:type II secretory pathway component GspD/PulD (secretin)